MSRFPIDNFRVHLSQAVLALACFAVATLPVRANEIDGTFSLKISEKAKAITDPTNTDLQSFLMWDLGSDRVMNRNMPYLELENLHDSQPITEFRMTVGDPRFHFDCEMLDECALITESPGGLSVASSIIAGDGDQSPTQGGELILNFGNGGLAPGEKVLFKIALGVDEAYDFFHRPDFRTVLFDMNEINVYDGNLHLPDSVDATSDNAKVTVKFGANGGSFVVGPVPVDDYNVEGEAAKYFNDHFRRYGIMENVDTFLLVGGVGGEVPEPSAAILAMVAAIGSLCMRRHSRHAA